MTYIAFQDTALLLGHINKKHFTSLKFSNTNIAGMNNVEVEY